MRLAPVFLGSLARRRAATLFSFAAIVLGVALGMAVQAVHEAALAEFSRGLRSMTGETDLQVLGPRGGFSEDVLATIAARPEVADTSPIVEVEARLAARDESLQVTGGDAFALARTTPALLPQAADSSDRFAMLAEYRIFLSTEASTALRTQVG